VGDAKRRHEDRSFHGGRNPTRVERERRNGRSEAQYGSGGVGLIQGTTPTVAQGSTRALPPTSLPGDGRYRRTGAARPRRQRQRQQGDFRPHWHEKWRNNAPVGTANGHAVDAPSRFSRRKSAPDDLDQAQFSFSSVSVQADRATPTDRVAAPRLRSTPAYAAGRGSAPPAAQLRRRSLDVSPAVVGEYVPIAAAEGEGCRHP